MTTTIIEIKKYRSTALVNQGTDRIKITLDMHALEWFFILQRSIVLTKAYDEFRKREENDPK